MLVVTGRYPRAKLTCSPGLWWIRHSDGRHPALVVPKKHGTVHKAVSRHVKTWDRGQLKGDPQHLLTLATVEIVADID